jgi:hypothetical protein
MERILQILGSLTLVYELVFCGGGLICYLNHEINAIIHLSISPLYFRNGPFRDSAKIRSQLHKLYNLLIKIQDRSTACTIAVYKRFIFLRSSP